MYIEAARKDNTRIERVTVGGLKNLNKSCAHHGAGVDHRNLTYLPGESPYLIG